MTVCSYLPRVPVHADRFGSSRPLPPLWIALHTSEGGEGTDSARNLASFMTRPGDRTTSSGSRYGASYHAVTETALRIIPAVHDHLVAFSASGANTQGLHLVIPGRAGQTRDQWLEDISRAYIRTAAGYIIDKSEQYGIPIRRLSPTQLKAKFGGYCDHNTISEAFGLTDHWDVGPNFPWDVLADDITDLTPKPPEPPKPEPPEPQPPEPEDEEVLIGFIKHPNNGAVYQQWSNGTKTWVPDEGALAVHNFINGSAVKVTTLPNCDWMQAAGPIVGPRPSGVDAWGCPV